ncbi:MAG: hypothetical protein D6751_03775 [Deltaproteobacteria bacterium]|nr:MAG: hypothetical protein D6751_03775 [Deltaproteobacteria bacterium]
MSGGQLHYRLIQFFPKPLREEGKNIGVIAYNGRWAGFRGIGMQEGSPRPNLAGYATIAGETPDIWVFGEWIEWFKALCRESEGNADMINAELDALPEQSPQFAATPGGVARLDGEKPETVLEEIFGELVGEPRHRGKPKFREQVRDALIKAELWFLPEFEEAVEVTLQTERPEAEVFALDYFLEGQRRAGFKAIRFKGARRDALDARVNDAIHAFSVSQESGFLDRDRCIVLCDGPCESRQRHEDRLLAVATLIDVTREDAHRRLTALGS